MSNIKLKKIVEVVVDNKENQHGDKRQTQQVLAQREKIAAEEREKQIEELARVICDGCTECKRIMCPEWYIAQKIYNAGYRKQIECEDVSRFRGVFECSECHWTDEDIGTADQIRFCAGCGAKVKGGEREMPRHIDVMEVVRCKDCDVPHNKWTGCPNLNGMIPPPEFFCAFGVRKPKTADATAAGNGD